jgi:hypothetical protein
MYIPPKGRSKRLVVISIRGRREGILMPDLMPKINRKRKERRRKSNIRMDKIRVYIPKAFVFIFISRIFILLA